MNISSVSSSNGSTYTSVNNDVKQLEEKVSQLQQQIQKENQSKDDAKTKEEKIKELQQQIQLIEIQIQQKKTQKQKISQESPNSNASRDSSETEELVQSISSNKLDVKA